MDKQIELHEWELRVTDGYHEIVCKKCNSVIRVSNDGCILVEELQLRCERNETHER